MSTSDQQLLFLNISEVLQVFHEGIYDYVPGFYQIRCNLKATTAVHRKSTAQMESGTVMKIEIEYELGFSLNQEHNLYYMNIT